MGIRDLIFQQAIAVTHGFLIGQHSFGMIRRKAEGQAVKETATPFCRLDPQTIHRGHQPDDTGDAGESRLWGRFFVDPHLTGLTGFGPGFHLMVRAKTPNFGADLPAQTFRLACDFIGSGTAQASARRQQRHRLKNIGLACAIRPHQRDGAAIKAQSQSPMAAKMRQRKLGDGKTGHALPLPERRLDAHWHDDVDRRRIIAFAHQGWIARRVEHENRIFTIHLAGNFQQVFGVEANFEPFVIIGDGKFFFGSAAVRRVDGKHKAVFIKAQLHGTAAFRGNGGHAVNSFGEL